MKVPSIHDLDRHTVEVLRGASTAFVMKAFGAGLEFGFNLLLARMLGGKWQTCREGSPMKTDCTAKQFSAHMVTIAEGRFSIRKSCLRLYLLCLLVVSAVFLFNTNSLVHCAPTVFTGGLTLSCPDNVYDGYTLYALEGLDKVLVLDISGDVVHSWNIMGLIEHVRPLFMW